MRQAIGDGVDADAFGEFVDEAFEGEDVGQCAEAAQGGGADRGFQREVVDDAFGAEIVEREAVAGAAAAVCLDRIVGLGRGRFVRQRLVGEHGAAEDGALDVGAGPDLGGPVGGTAVGVEGGAQAGHVGGADGFEAEFLLAAPLHADAMIGDLQGDDGGIEGGVVGAVMAVAAGAVGVADGDLVAFEAENVGEAVAQGVDALGVGPDGQMAVAEFGEAAGRGERGMGDEGAGVGLADDCAGFGGWAGIADVAVIGRLVAEPGGFLLERGQDPDAGPFGVGQGGDGGALDGGFIGADEGDEIADADDADRRRRPCGSRAR